ncbi:MAG: hypothetical protein ACD_19C00021G0019 [uncultured bacterium]|nr:MAG: hypothetical protein ACD_19C00021G0019 [uncultured bacterium]
MFKSIFLPLIAVVAFIILVGLLSQGKLDPFIKKVSPSPIVQNSKTIKIVNTEIKIEVAKSNEERSKGLSNRTKLDDNSGMVFIFPKDSKPVFWMKDTKIPLDLIWIDDNKIVGIDKNVQPEPSVLDNNLKKYPAPTPIDYVLEVNGEFSDKNNIKIGETISGLEQL